MKILLGFVCVVPFMIFFYLGFIERYSFKTMATIMMCMIIFWAIAVPIICYKIEKAI